MIAGLTRTRRPRMIRRCAAFLVLAACVALLSGCVSTDLTGAMMPGAQLPPSEVYFVEKFKPDGRSEEHTSELQSPC